MSPDWSAMYHLQGQEFLSDTSDTHHGWLDKYIYPADRAACPERSSKKPFEPKAHSSSSTA